jgi:hypothetical protein
MFFLTVSYEFLKLLGRRKTLEIARKIGREDRTSLSVSSSRY